MTRPALARPTRPSAVHGPHRDVRPVGAWNEHTLRVLLAVSMCPAEWCAALAEIDRDRCDGERPAAVLSDLVDRARGCPVAPVLLGAMLDARLTREAAPFVSRSLLELANTWAEARDDLSGPAAAGLLWAVGCEPCPLFRKLERVVVQDVEARALRAFGQRGAS